MTIITTTSPVSVTQRTTTYAAVKMLAHAEPVEVLAKVGTNIRMPKNKGNNIKFRRPITLSAATTPLLEGVTPNATTITFEDVTATLKQYGAFSKFSDVVEDLHEDPVGSIISQMHGENIGRTTEAIDWGVLTGGTGIVYANGGARNATNTPISLSMVRSVVRTLTAQKAMRITEVLSPSPNYATRAVEAAFVALGHTNLESDIRNLPGFLPVASYGTRKTISDHEVGTVENVRFILSPDLSPVPDVGGAYAGSGTAMVSTTGTLADIYPIVFIGRDAWARVSLRIGSDGDLPVSVKMKAPNGEISDSDPLAQRGIVSWKMYYVSKILNEAWVRRLEVAATAL